MVDPKLIAVIIGIVGALMGVYFREAIKKAQARLASAVALESTLYYWFNQAMGNKYLREFLITGHIFGEKEKEAVLSNDIEVIKEFRKKFDEVLTEAKEEFMKEQKINISEIIRSVKALSKEEYSEILKEIETHRDSIRDENGFLGQKRLSVLDWHKLQIILEVKAEAQSILGDIKFGIIHVYTNDNPDSERIYSCLFSIIKSALSISKNLMPLMTYSKNIRERGLLRNIFS